MNYWIIFLQWGITIVFIECEDCDAVDTAKTDGATEYGKEEEKSGSNIPTGMCFVSGKIDEYCFRIYY